METNRLIAKFMGMTCHPNDSNVLIFSTEKAMEIALTDLKYHSSWDWLMPVVERIEQVIQGVPQQMLHLSLYSTINEVYQAVVEFINRYTDDKSN